MPILATGLMLAAMAGDGKEGRLRRGSGEAQAGRQSLGSESLASNRDQSHENMYVDRSTDSARNRDKDRDAGRDRSRSKGERDRDRGRDHERTGGLNRGSESSSREREGEEDGARPGEARLTPPGFRDSDGSERDEERSSKRVISPRVSGRAGESRDVASPEAGLRDGVSSGEQHTTPPGSTEKLKRLTASANELTDAEGSQKLEPPPPHPEGPRQVPLLAGAESETVVEIWEAREFTVGEAQLLPVKSHSPPLVNLSIAAAAPALAGTFAEAEPASKKRKYSPIRWDPAKGKDKQPLPVPVQGAPVAPTFRPREAGDSQATSPIPPPLPQGRPAGDALQTRSRPPLSGTRTRTPPSGHANGAAVTSPKPPRHSVPAAAPLPPAAVSDLPSLGRQPEPQTSTDSMEDGSAADVAMEGAEAPEPLDVQMADAEADGQLEPSESGLEDSEGSDKDPDEQGGLGAPATIATSRWAEDARAEEGSGSDGGKTQGSGSPEPGEYVPRGSGGRENGEGSGEQRSPVRRERDDAEYERELNRRELEALDGSDGEDSEEQRPETDSEEEEDRERGRMGRIQRSGPGNRIIDMLQGCRSVDEFERLNRIDEGTYGVVYRARDKRTGEIVALKKVKMDKEREGFPLTSLREINILLSFHHSSIVDVKEVVVGGNLDSIFMVMEYMEHDLKSLMESLKQPFSQSEVKCLMLQLLEGTKYLHDNWVLHRDLKTSNLLLNNRGELKICDFGLARQYGSPLKAYTHMVVTLWYRAPELLLGTKQYSVAVDLWSLGCIMAELLTKEPLFTGKSEIDQIDKIFKLLGTPNERIWPEFPSLPSVKKCNFLRQPYNKLRDKFPPTSFGGRPALSEAGFDLLNKLLTYDPKKRITAEDALQHEWFGEVPLPKEQELMPTFPARHEHDRRLRRLQKSPDPLEERKGRHVELGAGGLFG